MRKLILSICVILCTWSLSFAEGPLHVGVNTIVPNVIKNGEIYSGFDIDLWEAIAKDANIDFQYQDVEFKDMFNKISNNEIDVGIAGITITHDREQIVDFSHHYLDSGLRILVPPSSGFMSIIKTIFNPSILKCLLYILIFIIVCGHILWVSEQGKDIISDKYFPGIFEAFWCIVATMTTVGYGDIAPKKWSGRMIATLVMLVGISFFGIMISQMTSVITTHYSMNNISCLEDLRGLSVGTESGTTSETILRKVGAKVVLFDNIEQAYKEVINKKLDASIFDSPNVLYFSENEGKDKVTVIDKLFDKQYYGFAVTEDKPELTRKINLSLLKLVKNGEYDRIYKKWFN